MTGAWAGKEVTFHQSGKRAPNMVWAEGTAGTKAWRWPQEGLVKQQDEGRCDGGGGGGIDPESGGVIWARMLKAL